MEKNTLSEFWKLLNQVEDFYASGFADRHRSPNGVDGADGSHASPSPRVAEDLEQIRLEVAECTLCPLYRKRKHAVPGEGSDRPLVLMVGEGPGAEEDRTGRPFVGPVFQPVGCVGPVFQPVNRAERRSIRRPQVASGLRARRRVQGSACSVCSPAGRAFDNERAVTRPPAAPVCMIRKTSPRQHPRQDCRIPILAA